MAKHEQIFKMCGYRINGPNEGNVILKGAEFHIYPYLFLSLSKRKENL